MESFVWLVAPIAIALFGFVIFWGIAKAVSSKDDSDSERKENNEVDERKPEE